MFAPLARLRAVAGLTLSLTLAAGLAAHLLAEAIASRDGLRLDVPEHFVTALAALGFGIWSIVAVGGAARGAERRRRLALAGAALRATRSIPVAIALGQVALALALFGLEHTVVEPERLAPALVTGLLAVLVSTRLLRGAGRRIVAIVAAAVSFELAANAPVARSHRNVDAARPAGRDPFLRRLGLRAPPLLRAI